MLVWFVIYHVAPQCDATYPDCFALGVLLFELVVGVHPWKSARPTDPDYDAWVNFSKGFAPPTWLSAFRGDTALADLVEKLLKWKGRLTDDILDDKFFSCDITATTGRALTLFLSNESEAFEASDAQQVLAEELRRRKRVIDGGEPWQAPSGGDSLCGSGHNSDSF